ncbi:hypothetical protein FG386_001072 [Cryptosporidium ryanae]|uniref:uncharacterized protein n=1 Tax=Cryptosporidium ryanae TaxID=515981 RepID=UPI00351A7AE4|nr:hypothetical protein FG386_001072 [Cryptosporidium ryanae]
MEENEESIVNFFSLLGTIIPNSNEFIDSNNDKFVDNKGIDHSLINNKISKIERTIDNIKSKCSLNDILYINCDNERKDGDFDDDINAEKRYLEIIKKIPDIHEVKEAISSGCLDQEDFEILVFFFKSLIELCKPENITIMLCNNSDNKKDFQLESPINNLKGDNNDFSDIIYKKNSIFPQSIRLIFSTIIKFGNSVNSSYVLFQICNYVVEALIGCSWSDDNLLSWFSRPALSDLLITLSSSDNREELTDKDEITLHKIKQCCNYCHIKSVVLSSIFTKVIEVLKIIENSESDDIITISLIDNISICFSISIYLISKYHPSCYNIQINSINDKAFKSWWSIKYDIFNLTQFNNSKNKNIKNFTIYKLTRIFFNKLDSSHLNLKRISTKSHIMKSVSNNKPSNYKYFCNENLYKNIKLDLPNSLFGFI